MNKTGIDIALKPLEWKRGVKQGYEHSIDIFRALNVQLGPEVYSYYQIERQDNTGGCYLSIVVENDGDEYQSFDIANSRNLGELMELAEKDRVKNIGDLVKYTLSPADIAKTLMPPLEWRDVEVSTRYGVRDTVYAKILGFSKDGELYFQISQGAEGKFYLELKACMDSEDTVKGYLYSSYDVEELKKFAEKYRMNQIAKTLLN